ncbi:hypothetical protein [Reichenbachiella sp.]|uniref:hypothetical protein n=1 Tax=Reichenbachiella sp. TaxID=2184521 RepID=UPI003B5C251D
MKSAILILLAMLTSLSTQAQQVNEENDVFRSTFGKARKTVVKELIPLDKMKGESFNKIYDEYASVQKNLAKEKYALLNNYVESYYDIDNEKAGTLMKKALSIRKQETKMMTKYYKKMSKACGAKVAAQFYQIENYFNSTIALVITENLPFIGEIE